MIADDPKRSATMGAKATIMITSFKTTSLSVTCGLPA